MNRRTEEYIHRLDAQGAQWSTSEDPLPRSIEHFDQGTNPYEVLQQGGLLIADRSERDTLVIHGEDSAPWLQGLVTNDVFALAQEGTGQRTHAVNHIGRTVADIRLMHLLDMLVADLEPGNLGKGFLRHLKQHIITEKVKLSDRSDQTSRIAIFGQHAPQALASIAQLNDQPHTLKLNCGTVGQIANEDVIVQRLELIGQWGFELYVDRAVAHKIWDLLNDKLDLTPVGQDTLELLRLEAGVPRFGKEYTEKNIPIEADLNDTINYDKGCYLGQEIIHRLDTRGRPAKMLRLIVAHKQEDTLQANMAIEHAGRKVGKIQTCFQSPKLDKIVGIAYLKRGAYDPGTPIEIKGPTGAILASVERMGFAINQG